MPHVHVVFSSSESITDIHQLVIMGINITTPTFVFYIRCRTHTVVNIIVNRPVFMYCDSLAHFTCWNCNHCGLSGTYDEFTMHVSVFTRWKGNCKTCSFVWVYFSASENRRVKTVATNHQFMHYYDNIALDSSSWFLLTNIVALLLCVNTWIQLLVKVTSLPVIWWFYDCFTWYARILIFKDRCYHHLSTT